VIGTDYDSMLGKVIATGPTRGEAVRLLVDALRRARIHGVGTNRDLLVAILDHDEFMAGKADTGFLERHPPEDLLAAALDPRALQLHALAAALAAQAASREAATALRPVRSGFRNNPGPPSVRRFVVGTGDMERELAVGYRLGHDTGVHLRHPSVANERRSSLFTVDGEELPVALIDARPDVVDLVVDGVRRRFDVRRYVARGPAGAPPIASIHVDSALGSAAFRIVERFPSKEHQRPSGSLVAPMPGTVVKVLAAPGDTVAKGDPVVVIEAMKMEHTIGAAGDGTVAEILVEVGRQVDIDQVIAVITTDDGEGEDSSGG
jgi:propionyl-CoA carboxylase alpha chain